MFSRRTAHEATPNAIAQTLAKLAAERRPVLDLTTSNPTKAGIPYDERAILGALSDPRATLYEPEAFGLPHAREAVAKDLTSLGLPVEARRVVLTASTSEAYSFLFKLLCDPGDDVLIPRPSYPLFEHLATFEAVRLVPYRLAYDGAWHVDLDSVRRAKGPRTRAILVVSPNNPTGSYLAEDEARALGELGLPVVSDEVFLGYPLGARRGKSLLEMPFAPLSFAMGGLSKLAALPQMKVAWTVVAGEPRLVSETLSRLELVCDSFLSVSAPVQHALPALLASRGVAESAIRARTRENLARVRAAVGPSSPVSVLDVQGGWYVTLRVPRLQSEEAWVLELLEKDGVHVHPGHFFDFEDEAYLVVSLLTPEPELTEGLARLLDRVARVVG